MKQIIVIFIMMSSSFYTGCNKNSISGSSLNGDPTLIGKWRAIEFSDINSMSNSYPLGKWIKYPTQNQYNYDFRSNGDFYLGDSAPLGRSSGKYILRDSIHLKIILTGFDTMKFSIDKLSPDTLILSKAWFEDQYKYRFIKIQNDSTN